MQSHDAEFLIAEARDAADRHVAKTNDPSGRYPFRTGYLESIVRALCDDIARMKNENEGRPDTAEVILRAGLMDIAKKCERLADACKKV